MQLLGRGGRMRSFLLTKGLQYILVMVVVVSINFLLPRLMPGNPLKMLGGEGVWLLSQAERDAIVSKHGLDRSLGQQYVRYLSNLMRGELGYSYNWSQPVSQMIAKRLPWTLLLTGTALILSTVLGVLLGTFASWRRGKKADVISISASMAVSSMPSFWLGMVLVAIFGVQLRILPIFGARSPWDDYTGFRLVLDVLEHLILPVTSLVLLTLGSNFLLMRYSMLDVLGSDYVFMARSKGLRTRAIVYKHAMRNALLPVATAFMLNVGFMFSGAIVTETVFAYPGIGRLMYEAALARDYPLLQGTFLVISITVIGANIISDLIYPLLDPRVRRPSREH